MIPQKEWLQEWLEKRNQLQAPADLNQYFIKPQINGNPLSVKREGTCFLNGQEIIVRDPLTDLKNPQELPYFAQIKAGEYPVEFARAGGFPSGRDCAAVRVILKETSAVRFEQALIGTENIRDYGGGIYGFFSDSGWTAICDEQAHQDFCRYAALWEQEHPDRNYQRDQLYPSMQGNVFSCSVPDTQSSILMFRVGGKENRFPAYWGLDEQGEICQLVLWMLDLSCQQSDIPSEERSYYNMAEDMPELKWDGKAFQGPVRLREWNRYFKISGMIPATLLVGELTDDEALDGCEQFFAHQYQVLDHIIEVLLDRYPLMQLEYGHRMADNAPEMPNVRYKVQFRDLMCPKHIVLDLSGQRPRVTAAFDCSWDREQGFGISVEGDQVLKIGTAEQVSQWINKE